MNIKKRMQIKTGFLLLFTMGIFQNLSAQDIWITKKGQISFFSKTPLENVDAVNNEVSSALNTKTGEIGFAVLIKGFHFQRALMEEHFNENYMESDKYPKAVLKGKIADLSTLSISKDGAYPVTVEGDLTVHGITHKVVIPGTLVIKGGKIEGISKFKIALKDYNIKVPSIVADKISETIDVTVDCRYDPKT